MNKVMIVVLCDTMTSWTELNMMKTFNFEDNQGLIPTVKTLGFTEKGILYHLKANVQGVYLNFIFIAAYAKMIFVVKSGEWHCSC